MVLCISRDRQWLDTNCLRRVFDFHSNPSGTDYHGNCLSYCDNGLVYMLIWWFYFIFVILFAPLVLSNVFIRYVCRLFPKHRLPRYNWNIVEGDVKHHKPNQHTDVNDNISNLSFYSSHFHIIGNCFRLINLRI